MIKIKDVIPVCTHEPMPWDNTYLDQNIPENKKKKLMRVFYNTPRPLFEAPRSSRLYIKDEIDIDGQFYTVEWYEQERGTERKRCIVFIPDIERCDNFGTMYILPEEELFPIEDKEDTRVKMLIRHKKVMEYNFNQRPLGLNCRTYSAIEMDIMVQYLYMNGSRPKFFFEKYQEPIKDIFNGVNRPTYPIRINPIRVSAGIKSIDDLLEDKTAINCIFYIDKEKSMIHIYYPISQDGEVLFSEFITSLKEMDLYDYELKEIIVKCCKHYSTCIRRIRRGITTESMVEKENHDENNN